MYSAFAAWRYSEKPLSRKSSREVGGRGREVEVIDHPQGVLPQNWGFSKPYCHLMHDQDYRVCTCAKTVQPIKEGCFQARPNKIIAFKQARERFSIVGSISRHLVTSFELMKLIDGSIIHCWTIAKDG
ncbi:hypothetical protein TNCV_57781 [Trichonephila clavipes]|nr:hypothetical protein TNCV_57781 [Trichonephila clavipes]